MSRPHPTPTRTYTLFPPTTLFRSSPGGDSRSGRSLAGALEMVARCRRGGAGGSARPASMGPEPRSFLRIEFEPAPGQEALFGGRRAAAVARAEQRFLRHERTSVL